ncbi:MAG: class I SAM-dependent methyltransferase [Chloroflexi bacterium]|nr:class I SAM-dependent methyltransferase [Chloroflexota bacterium]
MTHAIRDHFEQHAASWDDMMPADLTATLRAFLVPFADDLASASSVLEIGTGTGILIPLLQEYASAARLVSIDLAHTMLQYARQRCPDARLVQADVHRLPFSTHGAFDLVVCHNSFPHFADGAGALRAIGRVLVPGGGLLILHNNSRERVNAIHSRVGGPIAYDWLPPGEKLHEMLVAARYQDVAVEDSDQRYVARGQWP